MKKSYTIKAITERLAELDMFDDVFSHDTRIASHKSIVYKHGRGGYYGMETEDALEFLDLDVGQAGNLPSKVGFSLQDMGGGINVPRLFNALEAKQRGVPSSVVDRLLRYSKACRSRYMVLDDINEQLSIT